MAEMMRLCRRRQPLRSPAWNFLNVCPFTKDCTPHKLVSVFPHSGPKMWMSSLVFLGTKKTRLKALKATDVQTTKTKSQTHSRRDTRPRLSIVNIPKALVYLWSKPRRAIPKAMKDLWRRATDDSKPPLPNHTPSHTRNETRPSVMSVFPRPSPGTVWRYCCPPVSSSLSGLYISPSRCGWSRFQRSRSGEVWLPTTVHASFKVSHLRTLEETVNEVLKNMLLEILCCKKISRCLNNRI